MNAKQVGSAVFASLVLIASCGRTEKEIVYKDAPMPQTGGETGQVSFAQVKPLLDRHCAQCHNGGQQRAFTQANFKQSGSAKRIRDNNMPPAGNLPAQAKMTFLGYLER
ncbi:MAG: hypothetical protein ACPG32_14925 [Akkermansiaceae bacterium]